MDDRTYFWMKKCVSSAFHKLHHTLSLSAMAGKENEIENTGCESPCIYLSNLADGWRSRDDVECTTYGPLLTVMEE